MKRDRKVNVQTVPCHVFGGVHPRTGQPIALHNWKGSRQCQQCGRTRRQVRIKRKRGAVGQ